MYKHITPRYHRQQLMTSIISALADEPSSTNLTKVITTTSTTLVILIIIVVLPVSALLLGLLHLMNGIRL